MSELEQAEEDLRQLQKQIDENQAAIRRDLILRHVRTARDEINAAYDLTNESDESLRTWLEWALNYIDLAGSAPEED